MAKKQRQKRMFLELPLSPQTARVTLVGKGKLFVENHGGLLEVNDSRVRVKTQYGEIMITGMQLILDTDGAGMVCINGQIAAISVVGSPEDV